METKLKYIYISEGIFQAGVLNAMVMALINGYKSLGIWLLVLLVASAAGFSYKIKKEEENAGPISRS